MRHDLTLAFLVIALLAVSAGVLAAAVLTPERSGGVSVEVQADVDPAIAALGTPTAADLDAGEAAAQARPGPAAASDPGLTRKSGAIRSGDVVGRVLDREGVPGAVIHKIDRAMRPHFDFRRARPGHEYTLFHDSDGELVKFVYKTSEFESYVVRREAGDDAWFVEVDEVVLEPRVVRIAGMINHSLHEAVVQLGEKAQLANDFSEIFAWDLDFSRSAQPGDEFRILYERLYRVNEDGTEQYVRPGLILAARYTGAAGDYSAVYYEPEEGRGGYYRPDGSSVEGQFVRAPLRYSRISSRFTGARRHPILKITRPHHGIDYAAPRGTPVWSIGDGKVIYRGWAGGFGNLVKVRHHNGYISYYAHLERFAKGIRVGKSVQQKQVVGYVGSTGLATGPHVCFRMMKDGHYVDPMRLRTPAGPPVPKGQLGEFATSRDILFSDLDSGPLVAIDEAL